MRRWARSTDKLKRYNVMKKIWRFISLVCATLLLFTFDAVMKIFALEKSF